MIQTNKSLHTIKIIEMATSLTEAYRNREINIPRYPLTGRPIHDRPFVGTHCVIGSKYLPVVRYESLYYGQLGSSQGYCGTYYYYEPDSNNFLNLGKTLVAANKIDAVIKLDGYPDGLPYIFRNNAFIKSVAITSLVHVAFKLFYVLNRQTLTDRADLRFLYSERPESNIPTNGKSMNSYHQHIIDSFPQHSGDPQSRHFRNVITRDRLIDAIVKMMPIWTSVISHESELSDPRYFLNLSIPDLPPSLTMNPMFENIDTGEYLATELVALTDRLDQYICLKAQQAGYDTILLQREPGETRAVTEILDVRDRHVSYENICKDTFEVPTHPTKYPTIWFPEYGFMTYTKTP
jgi:hypothetical protein